MKISTTFQSSLAIKGLERACNRLSPFFKRPPNFADRRTSRHIHFTCIASTPKTSVMSDETTDPEIARFQEHQAGAAKLSLAEEARSLVQAGKWGVLSTIGSGAHAGYPAGSVVEYASDVDGYLFFAFSSMSSHTSDVRKNGKASITITATGFKGLEDARISLIGDIESVEGEALGLAKEAYRKRHPDSFWIDFGDFSMWKMSPKSGRLIGGFARAGQIAADQYHAAKPDPVSHLSAPIAGHMNSDHEASTIAIVKQIAGITVSKAEIMSLDRLGMLVKCTRNGETFRARIPFTRPVEDRKGIKDVVVEMSRAAAQSSQSV